MFAACARKRLSDRIICKIFDLQACPTHSLINQQQIFPFRNGHMLTHRNKKPYECKAEGCGKSYCDARSLRRHTENHHSSLVLSTSTTSSQVQSNSTTSNNGTSTSTITNPSSSTSGNLLFNKILSTIDFISSCFHSPPCRLSSRCELTEWCNMYSIPDEL